MARNGNAMKAPAPLAVSGNLRENWKLFKLDFLNYIRSTENHNESAETQVAIFLNLIGENGLKIFNNLQLTESQVSDIDSILIEYETICNSEELNSKRSKFYTRIQCDDESVTNFYDALCTMAKECYFGTDTSMEIKYRIYLGLRDAGTKRKLQQIDQMTLDEVMNICKADELYKSQQKLNQADGQVILHQQQQSQHFRSTECVLNTSTKDIVDAAAAAGVELPTMKSDYSCGIFGWHPKSLQKYANSRAFLIVFGLVGTIQSMAFMYFIVTLTTLEKRFKIPSQTTGIIISGNEISQILLSLILSYAGGQRNRPRWIAWGVIFCSLSCFILIIPHFMYGAGEDVIQLTDEYLIEYKNSVSLLNSTSPMVKDVNKLCSVDSNEEECDELASIVPLILIFLSQFVLGIGNTLYYSLGQSYLDDNTKKTNTPMMLAYAMSLRMLGPVFGFIVGYFSLRVFIDPSKTPLINDKDPRWLGAWWLGWLIIGTTILLFAFLMGMFPKELPKKRPIDSVDFSEIPRVLLSTENGLKNTRETEYVGQDVDKNVYMKDFMAALMRLLRNKLLIFNIVAGIFYILGSSAYITFLSKYMEVVYNKSASEASVIVGPLSILGLVIGFLASGYYISRFKPTLRTIFLWNTFVGLCIMGGQVNYTFLSCDNGNVFITSGVLNITNTCNAKCACDTVPYSPVCHEATKSTYFSPCHAGCNTYDDKLKRYTNCHCTDEATISAWLRTSPIDKLSTEMSTWTSTSASPSSSRSPSSSSPLPTMDTTTEIPESITVILNNDKSNVENQTNSMQNSPKYNVANLIDSIYIVPETEPITIQPIDDDDDTFLIPGVCLAGCSTFFYIMTGISLVINTLSGTGRIGNILLNFRVVSKEDKSLAQGLTLMLISLFALIPGPIIFGYIIDSTCLIWNEKCGSRGNCQLHDQQKFRYYVNLTSVLFTSVGVFCDVLIWYYGKGIDLYGEDEVKRQQETERKNQHVSPLLSRRS